MYSMTWGLASNFPVTNGRERLPFYHLTKKSTSPETLIG